MLSNDAPTFVVQGTQRACLTAMNAVYDNVNNIDAILRDWKRRNTDFIFMDRCSNKQFKVYAQHWGEDLGHSESTWELRVYHKGDIEKEG